jgi:hypothetical protein
MLTKLTRQGWDLNQLTTAHEEHPNEMGDVSKSYSQG